MLAASAPHLRSLDLTYLLELDKEPANPTAALPVELGRLSQLTHLRLHTGRALVTTAQVNAVVQTLPLLQYLTLHSTLGGALLDGFPLAIATSCSQLRHLEITCGHFKALPQELGRLSSLTRLGLNAGVTSLPDSVSRLTALRELDLSRNPELSLPPGLTACWQLTRLNVADCPLSPVLARMHSLRRLSVMVVPGEQPREMFWTRLTGLRELQLLCGGTPVPAGLMGMTGLRKLGIYGASRLDELPAGPYLRCLESLTLSHLLGYTYVFSAIPLTHPPFPRDIQRASVM